MFQKLKIWLTSFLSLNKSEQRAILFTLILIILILTFNLMIPELVQKERVDFTAFQNELEAFKQAQQIISDSIRVQKLQNRGELNEELANQKLNPFPFNPNQLPEEIWLKLGLSEKQIRTIKNYEAKGGKFKRKEDLKKMYSISDAEYAILEEYIRIPSEFKTTVLPVESKVAAIKPETRNAKNVSLEINSADSSDLVHALKLSPWIASRIIRYREILGGFYKASQLKEVYGFDSSYFKHIEKFILVDTSQLIKININTSGFKEILRHPYISYEITKDIVNHRDQRGLFKTADQLIEFNIMTESTFIRVKPYLSVNLSQIKE